MPQADVSKLVSQLRINVFPRYRRLRNPKGPEGRHQIIRQILTGLFKYERIELLYTKADEARGYAERLIAEAIKHGDCHKPTMELADYWLEDKTVVHKLFKVLAPRYQNYNVSCTRMHKITAHYPDGRNPRSVLELRGNPFPPLTPDQSSNRNLIHNVLLDEAKKEYRKAKYAEMAEHLSAQDASTDVESSTNAQVPTSSEASIRVEASISAEASTGVLTSTSVEASTITETSSTVPLTDADSSDKAATEKEEPTNPSSEQKSVK